MAHGMPSLVTVDGRFPPQIFKISGDYSAFSPIGACSPLTPDSSAEEDLTATEVRLFIAGLRLQCREFADRYELCLAHLKDAAREAEALRLQNARLRIANGELANRLTGRIPIADKLQKLRIRASPPSVESPASVPAPRVSLPKSISVRSAGYKKLNSEGGSNGNVRVRVSKATTVRSPQRVHVGGGGESVKGTAEAGGALELEVYNQGMFKTELCNKWQETGDCPYGDHCQFGHGIGELRAVIRHPRYKTEVCRMVLAGDHCPYGHRCHFRHALSPSDHPRLAGGGPHF